MAFIPSISHILAWDNIDAIPLYTGCRPLGTTTQNARILQHDNAKAERLRRDENLRAIRKSGRKA